MRCVECGYPKDRHGEAMNCPSGGKHFASMEIPQGLTCNDCRHVVKCCAMFGAKPGNRECDFYPIRFSLHPRYAPGATS
jgi:hypothetical protein